MSSLQYTDQQLGDEIRRRFGKDKVLFIVSTVYNGEASIKQVRATIEQHDRGFKHYNRALDDCVIDKALEKFERDGVRWFKVVPSEAPAKMVNYVEKVEYDRKLRKYVATLRT
jgi:hypothetical protein